MKIKLISPARKPEWAEAFWDIRTACKITGCKTGGAPLALPTLAALTPADIQVILTDEKVEPINFDEQVDLVAITSMTADIIRAYEIADEYRKRNVPVVMGGIHVSMLFDEAIEHCDAVIIGEAEEIWLNVLIDARDNNLQKYYHVKQFPDITESPVPRWDLLKYNKYIYFTIQAGRGCPYNCDFCSVKTFNGRKYRHKNISQVMEEIKYLHTLNSEKDILFADDNFLANPQYAKRLLNEIISLNFKKSFWCQASINRLEDEEMLKLMSKANFRFVFIGLESVSQSTINVMNKDAINDVENYKGIIHNVHEHKISVIGSFVLGNDTDDENIFRDTIDFINGSNILFAMVNILTPAPGTALFSRIKNEKRLITGDWNKYNAEFVCFEPKLISHSTLQKRRNEILNIIYSYNIIYRKFNKLIKTGVLKREKNGPILIKWRILLLIKALVSSKFSMQKLVFLLKLLCNFKHTSLYAIVLLINFHEYAKRIADKRYGI